MLQKSRVYLFGLTFRAGNPFLSCLLDWVCCFITGKSWFWRDCSRRLENELQGFQMAVSWAKMADGFQARNPETKADRCLPKLWGQQRGLHISACQATRLVITLSHAGREEMPAKDAVAPHPRPQLCQARQGNAASCKTTLNFKLKLKIRKKNMLDSYRTYRPIKVFTNLSLTNAQSGLPKMIYLIFNIFPPTADIICGRYSSAAPLPNL